MDHLLEGISKYFHKPELLNGSLFSAQKEEEIMQFMNSHILKANLARIVGLIHLLKIDDIENKSEIVKRLDSEVCDLQLSLGEIKLIIEKFIKSNIKK